jgi:integrase
MVPPPGAPAGGWRDRGLRGPGEGHSSSRGGKYLAGPAYDDGDLVFCDELGRPIHPQQLSRAFSLHRKAAGIPTGSLHILRHTAATLALTATPPVPLHVVAGLSATIRRRCSTRTHTFSPRATRLRPA